MPPTMIILADTAETIIGLLVGAVFVAAWVISALSSTRKKKRTADGGGQASWQDILRELSGAATGQQTPAQRPPALPAPVQQRQQQPGRRQKEARREKGRSRGAQAQAAAVPMVEMEEIPHAAIVGQAAAKISTGPRPPAVAAFLNRANLRNQIVLSEILQPPVALRQERRP